MTRRQYEARMGCLGLIALAIFILLFAAGMAAIAGVAFNVFRAITGL